MKGTLVLKNPRLRPHAQRIANATGCHVVPTAPSSQTLVSHGLARSSRWHLLTHEPPRIAVADLYIGTPLEAARVARVMAAMVGDAIDLLDNRAEPADLKAHPKHVVSGPLGNPSRPRAKGRNPKGRKRVDLEGVGLLVGDLVSYAELYHQGRMTHAQHQQSNLALWKEIEARGPDFKAAVLKALRDRENVQNPSRSRRARYSRQTRRAAPRGIPGAGSRRVSRALRSGRAAKAHHHIMSTLDRGRFRRSSNPGGRKNPAARKMRPVDFAELRTAILAVIAQHPTVFEDYRARGLSAERVRWDLLHASGFPTSRLYSYLNDSHIDTALRSIVGRQSNPKGRKRNPGLRMMGPSKTWHFEHGFSVTLPLDAIREMSGQGAADEAVAYWDRQVIRARQATAEKVRAELREYGAWDAGELADDGENWRRILWIAAGNLKDEANPKRKSVRSRANPKRRVSRARTRNPRSAVIEQAAEAFRTWQDRGPISIRTQTMRPPRPLPGAAAEMGKLVALTYRSDKYDGKVKDHEHIFDAPLATVVTDPDMRDLYIVRGKSKYEVTADGIKH